MERLTRTTGRIAFVLATAALAACGRMAPSGFSGDVETLLARGEAYADHLSSTPAERLEEPEILALGYLERARLGLGSPFRLIEYALRDPELPPEIRERVAYGILEAVLDGRVYQVDPVVLEATRFFGVPARVPTGAEQLDLIERTIAAAPTAISGERAVRLGYRIAEASGSTQGVPHAIVAHVAALAADRRRAADDARTLLRSAAETGADPLVLLPEWRRRLRFRVERPSLTTLTPREEASVATGAPRVAQAIEALALRLWSPASRVAARGRAEDPPRPLLDGETAGRLLTLASARDYPPQAPVAVAVSIAREGFLTRPGLQPWEIEARRAFVELAFNEERLAAAGAALEASGAASGPRLALMRLQAATFLRAWSQEEPWFPGDPGPAVKDLVGRFGLAAIDFDEGVPERWRPYLLRTVGRALSDLERVLPTASWRGLAIRIGPLPNPGRALALHDPATRTLYLPPASGAGTIAHEAAHDLDWQLARKRYGRRGYGTDLATRAARPDRIATSLQGLAAAFRRAGADTLIDAHDTRPAEVFARGTDWFIAATLAREGRTGGYLTSFQDPALTGYGTTRGPDIGGGAVPALLAILGEVAPVVEGTRDWLLVTHGPSRSLTPTELADAVLSAGAGRPPQERIAAIAAARERSLSAISGAACRLTSASGIRQVTAAQRNLVLESTAAAARGAALDAVRNLAVDRLGPGAARDAERWLAWRLYGAPEPVDSAVLELAPAFEDFLARADLLARAELDTGGSAFRPITPAALCGGNPFASTPTRSAGTLLRSRGSLFPWAVTARPEPAGVQPAPAARKMQSSEVVTH